jgi:hypothetical protein
MESYDDHRTTTAAVPGAQDEDCTYWLSYKDGEPDNPAPQDPGSQNTVDPPSRSQVTSPICDWVEHTLRTTDWDSISPDEHEADGDPETGLYISTDSGKTIGKVCCRVLVWP